MLSNYEILRLLNEIAIMQSLKDILKSLKVSDLPHEQSDDNLKDRNWLANRIKCTIEFIETKGEDNEEIHTSRKDEQESSTQILQ